MTEKLTIIIEAIYLLVLLAVTIKIIYDTHDPVKTLGYLLLTVFVPVFGMLFYFSFGVNYRKQKLYNKKIIRDDQLYESINKEVVRSSQALLLQYADMLGNKSDIARVMFNESQSMLSTVQQVKLLVNGENKFPEVLDALEKAKDHIHIEYYIYADDEIGNRIKEILIHKAKEGVTVRFIYDDFASHAVGKRMAKELREAGVEVYPFYKVKVLMFASRMNYRNHRKIIIVDGEYGFVGGINVDDRYINNGKNELYWRDTHIMMQGRAVAGLQRVFISDWNFCANQQVVFAPRYFPVKEYENPEKDDALLQIVDSGPDSEMANIMFAYMGCIASASKKLYLTTPYFIPNETIINVLKYAALKGVDVRLLVPGVSDSKLVNAASCSNYGELLDVGIRIYCYNKGFVHAKTMVVDDNLSVVGTANMDIRSYDLNFEINALVYNKEINRQLEKAFLEDITHSEEIDPVQWKNRSKLVLFGEELARLVSPLL